jgi:hypothetical protein
MHKCSVIFAVSLCVLVIVILPFVSATQITITEDKKYFPLPEENANIILLNGTSYVVDGVYYAAGNYSKGLIFSWYFPMFSTGNGTDDMRISAHNCNITITSFNSQQNTIGNVSLWYIVNMSSWLNYTITGTGTQSLDYFSLVRESENIIPFRSGNTTVYIDGALRQQGDGWNWTDFGLTVTGAASKVSIHSQETIWEPFRNPPHQPISIDYIFIIAVVVVIVALTVFLLMLNRHMQGMNNKRDVNNLF